MVKIKSVRLNMEFDGDIMMVRNGDEVKFKLTYESLVNILDHQTPAENTPLVEWVPVHIPNDAYPAFECIISDGMKTIRKYGAAPAASLNTKLDKLDPTACARRRAFCDAMAAFYEFDFSNCKAEDITPPKPIVDSGTSVIADVASEEEHGEVIYPDEQTGENVSASTTNDTSSAESVPATNDAVTPATPKDDELAKLGAVIVNFGKFTNANKTIAEIYEQEVVNTNKNPRNWFYYMCANMSSQTHKETINAMQRYKALMEQ